MRFAWLASLRQGACAGQGLGHELAPTEGSSRAGRGHQRQGGRGSSKIGLARRGELEGCAAIEKGGWELKTRRLTEEGQIHGGAHLAWRLRCLAGGAAWPVSYSEGGWFS
jgi:hypothetical protein